MHTSIIAAMSRNLVIGTDSGLPWRLPSDLQRFRRLTLGKPIILGRKTLALLGKPLDGRCNIVLTRQRGFAAPGCIVTHSLHQAMDAAWEQAIRMDQSEVMVIGGGEIYQQTIGSVDRMYLTVVDGQFDGTVFFPSELPSGTSWKTVTREYFPPDERNPFGYHFSVIEKVPRTDPRLVGVYPPQPLALDVVVPLRF